MYEITKNVFLVPGENNSHFPYCSCLYLQGKEMRVLIDAGMGKDAMKSCLRKGFDVLILSHCHIDHRLAANLVPDNIPVWCHEKEAAYLRDSSFFIMAMGFARGNVNVQYIPADLQAIEVSVTKMLAHGDRLHLGGMSLEVIHTPGHTPGHLAFHIPESGVLFAADVALTPFGPFYGHDFADIDDYIQSIRILKSMSTNIVVTGHAGPFERDIERRFSAYEEVIFQRDRLIMDALTRPRSLKSFAGYNLIYSSYPEPQPLYRWFELVHIEKQLERLIALGCVLKEGELFVRKPKGRVKKEEKGTSTRSTS